MSCAAPHRTPPVEYNTAVQTACVLLLLTASYCVLLLLTASYCFLLLLTASYCFLLRIFGEDKEYTMTGCGGKETRRRGQTM